MYSFYYNFSFPAYFGGSQKHSQVTGTTEKKALNRWTIMIGFKPKSNGLKI